MIGTPHAEFYVYTLSDPRTGAVFYVGKGTGQRLHHHEREAVRGVRSRKCQRIREIVQAGFAVMKQEVARFDDERLAYQCEADMIAAIGLTQLTNVLPGGGPQEFVKREAQRRARPIHQLHVKLSKSCDWLRAWLVRVESWPFGATVPGVQGGDQKAEAFVASVRQLLAMPEVSHGRA